MFSERESGVILLPCKNSKKNEKIQYRFKAFITTFVSCFSNGVKTKVHVWAHRTFVPIVNTAITIDVENKEDVFYGSEKYDKLEFQGPMGPLF